MLYRNLTTTLFGLLGLLFVSLPLGCSPEINVPAEAVRPLDLTLTLETARDYTLRLSDMPTGFSQETDKPLVDNESLVNSYAGYETDITLANLQAWGRLGGHQTAYNAPGLALFGTGRVESAAIIYKSAEGAREFVSARRAYNEQLLENGELIAYSPVSMPQIGDYSSAYRFDYEAEFDDGEVYNVTNYEIYFIKHNILISVDTYSFGGTGEFSDALYLAELIEGRIAD